MTTNDRVQITLYPQNQPTPITLRDVPRQVWHTMLANWLELANMTTKPDIPLHYTWWPNETVIVRWATIAAASCRTITEAKE